MRCPHCDHQIRAYRVLPEFSCDKCGGRISSNSLWLGLLATTVAIAVALPFEHTCTHYGAPSWLCGPVIFVGAVGVAYLLVYRPFLRLRKPGGNESGSAG